MKIQRVTWYLGNGVGVIGYGQGKQDAFSKLSRNQRQWITLKSEEVLEESIDSRIDPRIKKFIE